MPNQNQKWYHNWFNSPYYHILYSQRNLEEAEHFIDNICSHLSPGGSVKILDAACGKGRHSIYLNKKGYDVTGIDLSKESIKHASAFENEHLHFWVHDIRNLFYINYFDIVLNLFTSFGYFEKESDNQHAINMFAKALKPGGVLVMDFMNIEKIKNNLVVREVKTMEGIEFHIHRKIINNFVTKEISFEHLDKKMAFKEEVRALSVVDFERYFTKAGIKIQSVFGDYDLNAFDNKNSERLIFIGKKND